VTTLMGNFMLAPKISFVQPYGVAGLGAIKTTASGSGDSQTQIGWTIGGGLLVFVHPHIGLKGDVRYYHSLQALSLLGIDLGLNDNKVDFGRAGFGVVLKF
jgi:opacity protein-like surface antigen